MQHQHNPFRVSRLLTTARLCAVGAAALLASAAPALADWSHDFTEAESYAPDWYLVGTTTSGQVVSGASINFSTRPGANDLPQVGVLGTLSGGQQISTALAVVGEREEDYSMLTLVNPDVTEETGKHGLVLRVTDDLEGYAAVVDYTLGNLVIARFDLGTLAFDTVVAQPIVNFSSSKAYAIGAIVDGTSLIAEVYDTSEGDDDDDLEDISIVASASTNTVNIASGYGGIMVAADEATDPIEGTFYGAFLETTERECDYNGDNEDDLFWVNESDGSVWVWTMDDDNILGAQYIGGVPANQGWKLITTTDFDDDGKSDLLWCNTNTGEVGAWITANGNISYRPIASLNPAQWELAACGEMTEDGKPDFIWRNKQSNELWLWEMDRFQVEDAYAFFAAPAGWKVQAVADMDRDGDDDLIFRNDNGSNGILTMSNTDTVSWEPLPFVAGNWSVVGLTDVNDDEDTDLLWQNDDTGECATWEMDGTDFASYESFPSPGEDWDSAN